METRNVDLTKLAVAEVGINLNSSLGFLVGRVSQRMSTELNARFESLGLTTTQWRVMAALWYEDGITQKQIAERTAIDPSTLTVMLKRMETRGLITRARDAGNNRFQRVSLVEKRPAKIRQFQRSISSHLEAVNGHAMQGFTSAEQRTLIELLVRAQHNLDTATSDSSKNS